MTTTSKPYVAIDTSFYDHPEAFGTVSHMEGKYAIVALDEIPRCKCCTQFMPKMEIVWR